MTQDIAPPDALPIAPPVRLLLERLTRDRPTTILDIGANPINVPPYAALLKAGGCHVIGFEPQPQAFSRLQRAKGPNETYYPHAVGAGTPIVLRIYRHSGMTSTFRPHLPGMSILGGAEISEVLEEVTLNTVALDDLADLPPVDLVKIDIQGGEAAVFNAAPRLLAGALAVITELRFLRLYEQEPMLGGVDSTLRRHGFDLHRFQGNKSKALPNSQLSRLRRNRMADQLIDGDGIYIRDPGALDRHADAGLAHLAILAAAVFESHSLALAVLDEMVRRGLAAPDLPAAYADALPPELKA